MPDLATQLSAIATSIAAAAPAAYVRWENQPREFGKDVDISLSIIAITNLGLTDAFARRWQASTGELLHTQETIKRIVIRVKAEATEAVLGQEANTAIEAVRDYLRGPLPRSADRRTLTYVDATPSADISYPADRRVVNAAYIDAVFYALVSYERGGVGVIDTVNVRQQGGYGSGFSVGYL